MAKKAAPKKDKGPKGKKARLAAKIERQWGEQANEDEVKQARVRKGKNRLGLAPRMISKPRPKKSSKDTAQQIQIQDDVLESQDFSSDDDSVENENVGGESQTLNSLLKNITKAKGGARARGRAESDEENEDDDEDDDASMGSVGDDPQSLEDDDVAGHGMDQDHIEFDVERMQAKGANPYLSHFERPTTDGINALEIPGLKRIKVENLNENLVIQLSNDVRQKYDVPDS